MNKLVFATAFYHIEGESPNLKETNETSKYEKYYACIIVLFASIRKFYTEEKLILFSDKNITDKYHVLLQYYNVETIIINKNKLIYVNDDTLTNSFPGCLFTLDVLNMYTELCNIEKGAQLCILDSDIIMRKKINITNYMTGIEVPYPIMKKTNGQSRNDLYKIYKDYLVHNTVTIENFRYFGGELIIIPMETLNKISYKIDDIIKFIKSNNSYGTIFTEEHILSIVFNIFTQDIKDHDNLIKRLWTADTYNNIVGDENNYCLLHMPAEKDSFFNKMYLELSKNNNYFNSLKLDEYLKLSLEAIDNLKNPSLKRYIKILFKKTYSKIIKAK